ncbi:Ig-like domain-containing protein [Paenibacillus sp. GCM10012307]|uniref:Glycoside hydrolase family 3 C-terminal domain-containing protein n=1 Tax=Paenibacillus roseus TaxID=2798579 RepID=A0A934J056_9BACL|nr:Ig-like domain-containing protein [Paenibacillus roseus]MBJ6362417.1 glycoside hydrolase family 3 C-terminal domain-containing protein [Paenibacillus roseus]
MKSTRKKAAKRLLQLMLTVALAGSIFAPIGGIEKASAQVYPGLSDVARQAASEGIVLLQNPGYTKGGAEVNTIGKVLPINKSENVAVFGRIQAHYYKSGTGSGGAVRVEYVNGILEGIRNNPSINVNEDLAKVYADWIKLNPFNNGGGGWAAEPWSQAEMPLTDVIINQAKQKSDTAIVIIGRTAGEDRDNTDTKGAYQLTDIEVDMLNRVYAGFERVAIVLNVANVIDMSWAKNYPKAAIVYAWQGGMEGGSAVADVLTGDVTPSGKLSDTIAQTLADYPSTANFGSKTENAYAEDIYVGYRYFETFAPQKVLYPFGFGLSYTDFEITTNGVEIGQKEIKVNVTVKNTGRVEGKEVVQIYYGAPQGRLGKPVKELAAFAKTGILQPNQSQAITLTFDIADMASYDDSGVTGNRSAYVLEAGDYQIYVGNNVRSAAKKGTYTVSELKVVKQLQEALAPTKAFQRIKPGDRNQDGTYVQTNESVPLRQIDLNSRIQQNLPAPIERTENKGYKLIDVYNGRVTMDAFIAQFTNNDLGAIILGEGMSSPKVTAGTAAAFGGVTNPLLAFGLPIDSAADGPSGIRMETNAERATSIPNGTMLASTWNLELNERLFDLLGKEMLLNQIDTLLGPGVNIHRNPLNGRNFEYFSEDPLLTGAMATAQTIGLQKNGTAPTIKHFTANNQEGARHEVNALVSERALREIYLKGYEMAIKTGKARAIMTSYGPVNGTWAATNYDLNTTILRGEWGFDGIVMTDWWAKLSEDQGFYNAAGSKYNETNGKAMVRAQNDLYMVIPHNNAATHKNRGNAVFNTISALDSGQLTLGELQRSAKNIAKFLILSPAFARTANIEYKVNYEPGKAWFRVETVKLGDPKLSGITVGGKRIKTFNALKLDYKAFGTVEQGGAYPTVQGIAGTNEQVQVVQATAERPAAVITVTAGGEKRIYKVIFSSEEGLEPIFDNPTYALLKNIYINGSPIEGFWETKFNYEVALTDLSTLPNVTFTTNEGVTASTVVDQANRKVTIRAVSQDQANTYVVQFGKLPQSDEFDSATLSSFWTINTDTATNGENKANWSLDPARGSLRITAERGDFWRDHADLKNYFQQEAFGNWEATVRVNMNKAPNQNYNGIGITASQDNDNYVWVKYEFSTNRIIGMVKETGSAEPVVIGQLTADQRQSIFGEKTEIYLRLKKVGSIYTGYVSADGQNFISVGSTTADYSKPKFGLLASNGSIANATMFYADFDYVRFNTDVKSAVKAIGKNTTLKAAETETTFITKAITPATCNDTGGGLCYTNNNKGEAVAYNIDVAHAGLYKLSARLRSSQSEVAQMSFGVYAGDKHVGTFDITTTKGQWTTFALDNVQLATGPQQLRIVFESSGIDLNWLKFQLHEQNVDTSALKAAIREAEQINLNQYSAYKKERFRSVLANIKLVENEPLNTEVIAEAIAELQAAKEDLNRFNLPINVPATSTPIENGNGIRIQTFDAPWIFAASNDFRFESGTDAMSYVTNNDLVYLGQIDLNKLVEIKVSYSRQAAAQPYFTFYTEADNTGSPVKRATTQGGKKYQNAYSGGSFIYGEELASINVVQRTGATWTQYGYASTKQILYTPNFIQSYSGNEMNFINSKLAKGTKNVYLRFNNTNANLQYIDLIYDRTLPDYVDVTFDLNYAGSPAPNVIEHVKDTAIGNRLEQPVRQGYTFGGWFANREGSGEAINAETVIGSNQTFYAYWVEVKHNITALESFDPVSVEYGTVFGTLQLPSTVTATLNNGETVALAVAWSSAGYVADQAGTYTIQGTLTLQDRVLNPQALQPAIAVTVLPEVLAEIRSVETLSAQSVVQGTSFAELALPSQVAVTLSDGRTVQAPVTWSEEGYKANEAGSYTLQGDLGELEKVINPDGLRASIVIHVLPEGAEPINIVAVSELEGKSVAFGTAFKQLDLPAKVGVTLANEQSQELAVNWNTGNYNGNIAGEYTLKGTLLVVEGLSNTSDLYAQITIVVQPEPSSDSNVRTVQQLTGKTVDYGTAFDRIGLPAKVNVTLDNNETKQLAVNWSNAGYSRNVAGKYTLYGALVLEEGIANPQGLKAEIAVTVRASSSGGWVPPSQPPTAPEKPENPEKPDKPSTPKLPGAPGPSQSGGNTPGTEVKSPEQIKEELAAKFKDAVAIPNWAQQAIASLSEQHIFNGRTDGSFDPKGQITRAEFISIVVRSFEFSTTQGSKSFTDIADNAWYKNAIDIGTANGLIQGIGGDLFAPNHSITRQGLAVMLFNALKKRNVPLPEASGDIFPDDAAIAGYAKDAIYAFKTLGILNGRADGTIDPTAPASRAEAAVIVYKVLQYYERVTTPAANADET